ncbi:MAG TPA: cell wall hydrolase [Allosphingosinicella sp.]|jgi:spore germination cell wall hydrolase CwlJ-like protein
MLHKSMLGLPMLLLGASCVPPLAASQGIAAPGAQAVRQASARAAPLPPAEAIAPGQAAEPFIVGERSERDVAASLQCLTAAVYYEARSESSEGQRAVAQVVLNRARHPAFPKNICGVVYQGSKRRTGCQFSFTCDGSPRARRDPEAWARARRIAGAALAGSVYGPVGHATHYHASYVQPWWAASLHRAVSVGSHIFYRWRGDWGDPKSFRRPYLAAEVAERPERVDRPAVRTAAAPDEPSAPVETTRTFGVMVRRGGPPPRFLARAEEPAPPRQSASAQGVRVHSGLPDFMSAEAEPADPPVEVAVR